MLLMKPEVVFTTDRRLTDSEVMESGDWIQEQLDTAVREIARNAGKRFGANFKVEIAGG